MSSLIRRLFQDQTKRLALPGLTASSKLASLFSTKWATSKNKTKLASLAAAPTVTVSSTKELSDALSASASNTLMQDLPPSVIDAANQAAAGIAPAVEHNMFTQSTIDFLTYLNASGLPWWACIVGFAVALRIAVLPIYMKQLSSGSRTRFGMAVNGTPPLPNSALTAEEKQGQMLKLFQVYKYFDASPIKAMGYGLITAPPTIFGFLTLKGFLEDPAFKETLATGGLSPWMDLSVADPTYVLPTLAAGSTLVVMFDSFRAQRQTAQTKLIMKVFSVATVGSILFVGTFPMGFFYYWLTSNAVILFTGRLARSNWWAKKSKSPTQAEVRRIEADPELAAAFKIAMENNIPFQSWSHAPEVAVKALKDQSAREAVRFHEPSKANVTLSSSIAANAVNTPREDIKFYSPPTKSDNPQSTDKPARKRGIPKNFKR